MSAQTKITPEITVLEAQAILAIRDGADVYSYGIADVLRGMQRRGLPVTDLLVGDLDHQAPVDPGALFCITKPMNYTGDGSDQMPYFGAIATKVGKRIARAALRKAQGGAA